MVRLDKALLLDEEIVVDIKKISDYHLTMLCKVIEEVRLEILQQTTKAIAEVQQIVYRNGALTALALFKKRLQEGIKWNNKVFSKITREEVS